MPNIEVIKLMTHLIVTIVVIVGYITLALVRGEHDVTLQGALFAIIGYWFGAVVPFKKDVGGKNDGQN